jgi:hypothetical protein
MIPVLIRAVCDGDVDALYLAETRIDMIHKNEL